MSNPVGTADHHIESAIRSVRMALVCSKDDKERAKRLSEEMARLIALRSEEQVQRMEKKAGLQ